jgi:hypothetical protein
MGGITGVPKNIRSDANPFRPKIRGLSDSRYLCSGKSFRPRSLRRSDTPRSIR